MWSHLRIAGYVTLLNQDELINKLLFVFSQHTIPPISPPIEIHKPEKISSNIPSRNTLTVSHNSSLIIDPNIQRRHSMDTSQFSPTHSPNNTVIKSQSTIMSSPMDNSSNVSDRLLSPISIRKKSVSSKERLFSVESLHRLSSAKSIEHLIKVATQPSATKHIDDGMYYLSEQEHKHSITPDEQKSTPLVKQTSLNVTTLKHVNNKRKKNLFLF